VSVEPSERFAFLPFPIAARRAYRHTCEIQRPREFLKFAQQHGILSFERSARGKSPIRWQARNMNTDARQRVHRQPVSVRPGHIGYRAFCSTVHFRSIRLSALTTAGYALPEATAKDFVAGCPFSVPADRIQSIFSCQSINHLLPEGDREWLAHVVLAFWIWKRSSIEGCDNYPDIGGLRHR
jgi:hypothetical protein